MVCRERAYPTLIQVLALHLQHLLEQVLLPVGCQSFQLALRIIAAFVILILILIVLLVVHAVVVMLP